MRIRRPTLPSLKQRAPAAGLLALYLYLGFHAFSGSQGLISWAEQSAKAERLEVKLAALEMRRDALQADVDLLSSSSLDLDTLDI